MGENDCLVRDFEDNEVVEVVMLCIKNLKPLIVDWKFHGWRLVTWNSVSYYSLITQDSSDLTKFLYRSEFHLSMYMIHPLINPIYLPTY